VLPAARRLDFKPEELRWADVAAEAASGKQLITAKVDKEGRPVMMLRPRCAWPGRLVPGPPLDASGTRDPAPRRQRVMPPSAPGCPAAPLRRLENTKASSTQLKYVVYTLERASRAADELGARQGGLHCAPAPCPRTVPRAHPPGCRWRLLLVVAAIAQGPGSPSALGPLPAAQAWAR
jgi:hypothetical protein